MENFCLESPSICSNRAAGRRFLAWQGTSPPLVAVLTGNRRVRCCSKNLMIEYKYYSYFQLKQYYHNAGQAEKRKKGRF